MSKTRYELTDEHRARLPEYRALGDAIALRTDPITEDEWREHVVPAVHEMYRLAGLDAPRVVYAPSPMVAAFATGAAAWIWHCQAATWDATVDATWDATVDATSAATRAATSAATERATWAATLAATERATVDATVAATWDATVDATSAATRAATLAATERATVDATVAATWYHAGHCAEAVALLAGEGGLQCAARAWRMHQGGNFWANLGFYGFLRDVARLPIDWGAYAPYEALERHGSVRYMHRDFCIVSDFPVKVQRDEQGRPHCENGPFIEWRDGTACYAWHGVRVPAWIILHPERITPVTIDAESNAEVRRVQIERYGWARYVADSGFAVVDEAIDEGGQPMRLLRREVEGDVLEVLHVANSTADPDGGRREYVIPVEPGQPDVWAARNWTFDLPADARFTGVS